MSKKRKFYVVWHGKNPGIFESWEECKEQVMGFPNAVYKSFDSLAVAKEAYSNPSNQSVGKNKINKNLSLEQKALYGEPIENSIAVDGACNVRTGVSEYRGVWTNTKKQVFYRGPFNDGTNNLMEFLAIVHALSYCYKEKLDVPIYSDSRNAILWVKKKEVKTTQVRTDKNETLFNFIERAIKWLNTHEYTNKVLKWETKAWGEIPADFGRK